MEQTQRRVPEDAAVAAGRAEAIGAYLKRQRSLRGISLDELAATTRIPVRSLQRLESGAFDAEPDGFARGFVRTVAIALGLPPDETVARMLPEVTDEARRRGRRRALARRALTAALLATALGAVVWSSVRLLAIDRPAAAREVLPHRRDAVRALAQEHGLLADQAAPSDSRPEKE
jgi:transcriptional regulator with XRE-family HTH domain